ncbi:glutamate-1-semialdehyde 2,1-aminomutase [Tuwongella immobilis]|uniref:Glutamate-1-semialdehyde 2,1-aminomutase n=1 Tax=Tuwongella immobilis TaxID=692036 RepID=A0A6C2YUW0_9BACT|nr:glutamate-1-semialdehyde 2,1-aminomutase [Tuwongella immobilis]VIP04705.1 glutamate-1-semialdehyde aminotransferase : Glutamate-1-semialdehyde 2,1-aminomutase OS=Planctomyces limnophilus (strain ATCC 43296 / DSM 3776 / IFAM 1008 / 290) GN=hemL PE=3 SV=1: Aminotran_3 [Tuwongella immobilis]VTS06769.1 glutamate-1-semialdehyde aminotransferase : Glutamate-1-semialdehyde 2,1-aminomutase OS=Planctomyces limnophilus (strain ATCC 43296 / DSM 3776 / IFAM 1008 / 290) GN=hemL PE=3 SV=1: Aminotran_3 [Tuwo
MSTQPTLSRVDRPKSHEAFARAKAVIPGGVNSPARAFGGVGGEPIFMARGEGAYLIDLDGNRYLDLIGSWGPLILGHAHPKVVAAAMEAAQTGASFGAPCERESELAEMVVEAVPSIEMVRMTSSGTEAAMSAIRVARGATGRNRIVKFAGCYHGHVDALLVSAGSGALTLGVPNSPGVPEGCTRDTLVLRYNDVQQLEDVFRVHGDSIACVMLEPVVGNMGLVIPTLEFRKALRELTRKYGALLIYDEVMTGFRLSYGGAQKLFNDEPDMTALGKIIGGGYPVGAYGGRQDIMKQVMPAGPVYQAGTLSGNPVAMAAGIATLTELRNHAPYTRLDQLTRKLCEGLSAAATDADIPHQINRVGSMWTLFFTPVEVNDLDSAKTSDTARFSRFFWGMMDRGFYLPCSQFEAAFVSAVTTEAEIDQLLIAAREVFSSGI